MRGGKDLVVEGFVERTSVLLFGCGHLSVGSGGGEGKAWLLSGWCGRLGRWALGQVVGVLPPLTHSPLTHTRAGAIHGVQPRDF